MPQTTLSDRDFAVLMERHRDRLYRTCLGLTGCPQRAEDLCQEAMVRAWESRGRFEGRSAFSTWLIGIAVNVHRNQRRKCTELLTEDGVLDADEPGLTVMKELTAVERRQLVQETVEASLSPTDQNVVYMRYALEMPIDAITEQLQLPGVSGARAALQRIKRDLSRELRARLAELGHGTSFVRTQI